MTTLAVVGFGKIGQAVGAYILSKKGKVLAVDTNPGLLEAFQKKQFQTNEPGVQKQIEQAWKSGRLELTADFSKVSGCAGVIVCIPLLVDNRKRIVEAPFLKCFEELAPHLGGGTILSVETSIPVGFSRGRLLPLVEKAGKKHGRDFFLIHSPERIKSGTMLKQFIRNPKIIGGIDREAAERGFEIYKTFLDEKLIRIVSSIETAEMIKLAGMVYRDVNIALANQLAIFSARTGVDISEVVEHANTDGEAHLLQPGIGVGGHCTPVYPYFLIEKFKEAGLEFTLAKQSRKTNDGMAEVAADLVQAKGYDKALLLGLGFRPEVKEDIFSTAYLLKTELLKRHIEVSLFDPMYTAEEIKSKGFTPHLDLYQDSPPAILLVTAHQSFKTIDWTRLKKAGCRYFLDGRNLFKRQDVEAAGLSYTGIGR